MISAFISGIKTRNAVAVILVYRDVAGVNFKIARQLYRLNHYLFQSDSQLRHLYLYFSKSEPVVGDPYLNGLKSEVREVQRVVYYGLNLKVTFLITHRSTNLVQVHDVRIVDGNVICRIQYFPGNHSSVLAVRQ